MRFVLEDIAQQLSKVFKAAGRLRIRHSRRPDVTFVQEQVERAADPSDGAVGRLAAAGAEGGGRPSSSRSGGGSGAVLGASSPSAVLPLWQSLSAIRDALRAFVLATRDPLGGPQTLPPGECWALLEKHVLAPYEELAGLMRQAGMHVPQVRNFKLARSLYHAGSALTTVACSELLWTSQDLVVIAAVMALLAWGSEWLKMNSDVFKRFMFKLLGAISRDGEQHNINSGTWYISSLFILSVCFGKLPSCMGALALGVGDPAAALVGSKLGHIRVYGKKTLEGTAAFAVVSLAFFWLYMQGLYQAPLSAVLQIGAVGAISGAVAELYCPVPAVDDNLFVPVATAAAVTFFLALRSDALGLEHGAVPYSDKFDWTGLLTAAHHWLPFGEIPDRLPPTGFLQGTPLAFAYKLVPNSLPYFAPH